MKTHRMNNTQRLRSNPIHTISLAFFSPKSSLIKSVHIKVIGYGNTPTANERRSSGAGLGLTLARAVAEQHGGTLSLANRAEGGLRAEIRLPT